MEDLAKENLPTIEQVETIMVEFGASTIDDFSKRFALDRTVIQATIDCLRRLKRVPAGGAVPSIACFRDDTLESIVRCAGAKHGYM